MTCFDIWPARGPALLLLLLLAACSTTAPPRKLRLPARINEASGLIIDDGRMRWNNDSGDGPHLYTTDLEGKLLRTDTLSAEATDYEGLAEDPEGNIYVGDFGNNFGRRKRLAIYRYDPERMRTDSIIFRYPGQDGSGRLTPGNYNCEAMIWAGDSLHLFTKDILFGDRPAVTKHYRLPTRPGSYVAEFVDSLRIPRRVVTGAAVDRKSNTLYLVAYNYRKLLGLLPTSSASLIELRQYPQGRFLRGQLRRRNIAWAVPTQHEAVAIYDDRYLYVGAEATAIRKRAIARRLKRR